MLGSAQFGNTLVIADLEAGIGTLTRLDAGTVDVVVVVVEPTPRSIDVAQRCVELASERGQGRILIVANRITDPDDEARIRGAFPATDPVVVPYDTSIGDADRAGLSPLDTAPDSPAVLALLGVVERVTQGPPATR